MRHDSGARPFPYWTFAGLLLAGIGTWWLAERGAVEDIAARQSDGSGAPDYYVNDLTATTMTSEGNPARTLRTPHLQHLPASDVTAIQSPRFSVYQDEGQPWQVRAEHGQISADGEIILLQGIVTVEKAGTGGTRALRLVTQDLRIHPSRDYAETDEPVRVESDGDRIDASGMQAWLRNPVRLKFLSRVRGHYVPR